MQTKIFLKAAAVVFTIGFLVMPVGAALHVSQDVSQILVGTNWISGGLALFMLAGIKGELN